jgi:hypothetical protein
MIYCGKSDRLLDSLSVWEPRSRGYVQDDHKKPHRLMGGVKNGLGLGEVTDTVARKGEASLTAIEQS